MENFDKTNSCNNFNDAAVSFLLKFYIVKLSRVKKKKKNDYGKLWQKLTTVVI